MKIEIEEEGSCLGATGGTGRLIVRYALAKGHSVVVLVRSKARGNPTPADWESEAGYLGKWWARSPSNYRRKCLAL
jgi:NAD(P)-dependent dehydrogenase (short-subunit alcohol dehydrogenase family)